MQYGGTWSPNIDCAKCETFIIQLHLKIPYYTRNVGEAYQISQTFKSDD